MSNRELSARTDHPIHVDLDYQPGIPKNRARMPVESTIDENE